MSDCIDHPEVEALEKQIHAMKQQLAELRKKHCGQPITQNYTFKAAHGSEMTLAELFGEKSDLILIHNMGKHCSYCTLWADGFNGVVPHLEDRAAFVVVSNDPTDVQKTFAESRGWRFKMASSAGTSFFKDMGFEMADRKYWPGVSTFHKDANGSITRVAHAYFGPGDDFSALWHLFDLLNDGTSKWEPKFHYGSSAPIQLGISTKDGPH